MGKRVEKAMKEKLAASSASQDAEDDANKTPGKVNPKVLRYRTAFKNRPGLTLDLVKWRL